MAQGNFIFDLCFKVEDVDENRTVTREEILTGIQRRLDYLKAHPTEVLDAVCVVDFEEL